MTFVSWSVFGILFILSEFTSGTFFLLAIGLAFIYPAIADYNGVPLYIQLALLGAGICIHVLVVMLLRRISPAHPSLDIESDVGQQVVVIEWIDDCTARVKYRGTEWQADKLKSEMADAAYGVIQSRHGSRLIISTEPATM